MGMLLGVDVGTTAVKALLIDPETGTYQLAKRDLGLAFPEPEHVEQDPGEIWFAIKEAIREVASGVGPDSQVESLSLSTQGGTLISLDRKGNPLGKAIVWMDQRARKQAMRINERFGEDHLYLRTGWRATGCLPLFQLLWLREKDPNTFRRIAKFAFVADYITFKLSGSWVTDPTNAGITMFYNIEEGCWDRSLLELADISEDQLPTIVEPGQCVGSLLPEIQKELGLYGKPSLVVNGGHDQYCASLGAGAIGEGELLISGGTAWVVLLTADRCIFDTSSYFSPGRHLVKGRWGLLGSLPAAGAGLNWFMNSGGESGGRKFYSAMEDKAVEVPPGSEGLIFLPYFTGSTAPTWQGSMRSSILGLGLNHGRTHIFRALLEGVGFDVMWKVRTLKEQGAEARSVSMIGGATRSSIWPQIISDMLGLPLRIPRIQEAASLGAAILAGVGIGMYGRCEDGIGLVSDASRIVPVEKNSKTYEKLFQAFRGAFSAIRNSDRA